MKIVSILKNEKASTMSQIYLDNHVDFSLPRKRIDILELKEGMEISEDRLNYILDTEVYASAKSAAVSFLALRLRTAVEVERKLSVMGYEEATVNKVIENLKEINYINDYKYACKYISEKSKLKPKSVRLLSAELSQRGISDEIIEKAFEEFETDDSEVAIELLRKRYSKYSSFDEKVLKKMKSFLLSRGFSLSQATRAISSFVPDEMDL